MPHATTRRRVVRVRLDGQAAGVATAARADTLAVEEPLEIRVDGSPFSVTMRTPGHDVELAVGFLVAEGTVRAPGDVVRALACPDAARDRDGVPTHNAVDVELAPGLPPPDAARHRHVSSSCGICGVERIEAVRTSCSFDVAGDDSTVAPRILAELPARLRAAQRGFASTGGLHAAGLFTLAGDLICVREDVGRHNAVDKVVGWAYGRGALPLRRTILQVSGRASFELVQKALAAGCPILAAVSAPSSLAVDLAEEAGMTLIGFSRGTTFNVYTGGQRVAR